MVEAQNILAASHAIIPTLVSNIERHPIAVGLLLSRITDVYPVPLEHAGNAPQTVLAWQKWAILNGY